MVDLDERLSLARDILATSPYLRGASAAFQAPADRVARWLTSEDSDAPPHFEATTREFFRLMHGKEAEEVSELLDLATEVALAVAKTDAPEDVKSKGFRLLRVALAARAEGWFRL